MSQTHTSPIKTPRQLIAVVVVSFIAPILVIALLAALVTSGQKGAQADDRVVLERIQPVGTVVIAGPRTVLAGDQVYAQLCKTCHETGLADAPKLGDKAAWQKLIAQGEKLMVASAIKGTKGMPPKGGNPDLSDSEVHAAVVHMANAAGANWKAPTVAPAAAPVVAIAAASAPATAHPAGVAAPATVAAKSDGKGVYESACVACHLAGVADAPKLGDKGAWSQRLKLGHATLYAAAIKGKGAMPPKGGNLALSDDQVKAAVDYMLASVR